MGTRIKKEPVGVEIGSYSIDSPTLVLNPGTAHKKVESLARAFIEGGVIILDTESQEYKHIGLP